MIIFPVLIIFYFLLRRFNYNWWIPLGFFIFIFSILLSKIAPVLIFPLFYKFKPIEKDELKEKLKKLCENAGIEFNGIFSFNLSKNTKKGTAGFTGIGKSKRIIIADTLIDKFSTEEIESIFAHEVAHYRMKHLWKGIIIGGITTFAGLFIVSKLLILSLQYFNYSGVDDIAAAVSYTHLTLPSN